MFIFFGDSGQVSLRKKGGGGCSSGAVNRVCYTHKFRLDLNFKAREGFIPGPNCQLVTCSFVVKGDGWLMLERVKAVTTCTTCSPGRQLTEQ